jgi:glycerate 2-kinase
MVAMPHLVAAPDKFRGTATAREVARAVDRAAVAAGWTCTVLPLADGGEGTLDALGGSRRVTRVRGPLGQEVDAEWRLVRTGEGLTAVIEMARASGLELVGGPLANDPVAASSVGTGQLIAAAVAAGARRVVVGCGGSATTDGGLGAVEVLGGPFARGYPALLAGVEVVVACDVSTRFVDAAQIFAPQKGATPAQVALLERRLAHLGQRYADERGVDVRELAGSGAAGGLAGGLAALGAVLVPGFDLVAEATGLAPALSDASLVVTGEGHLDAQSLEGKVVGGVTGMADAAEVPALVVVGDGDRDVGARLAAAGVTTVYLVDEVGLDRAFADPLGSVEQVVAAHLARVLPERRLPHGL